MTHAAHAEIDWSTAEVADGGLAVALTGEPSKAWAKRVAEVVARLEHPGSGWGAVKVTRTRVTVAGVQPGAEGDLHHFLEGAVLQANTDLAPDQEPDGEADDGPDQAMTAAFRAFDERKEDER